MRAKSLLPEADHAHSCTFDAFPPKIVHDIGKFGLFLERNWFPDETQKDTDVSAKYNAMSRGVATQVRFVECG